MPLRVEIVTPKGIALDAEADEVLVPGVMGELGILPQHVPLLSGIKPGVVRLRRGNKQEQLAVGAGFVEVGAQDHVIVLTEECEKPEQVDLEDARRDLVAVEEKLRTWSQEAGLEYDRVLMNRAWAEARIKITEGRRS